MGSTQRRPGRRLLIPATVFAALLALMSLAIPAGAAVRQKSISFGAAGSGDGQFSLAETSGVAVNESNHDIYVADTGNHRVDQFDSTGAFIRAFGADVGGAGVNVCTSGCVAGTSGSAPGAFEAPTLIAVDNAPGGEGDVYVGDTSANLVSKFEADGTLVSSWGSGGQLDGSAAAGPIAGPFSEIVGIAVEASGNLDVLENGEHALFRFERDSTFLTDFETPRGSWPAGLGIDPNGDFFKVNGALTVEKFEDAGVDVGQVSFPETTTGIAVDPTNGELFAASGGEGTIENYAFGSSGEVVGSNCTPFPDVGCAPTSTFGAGDLTAGAGLAVDGTSHTVYVADRGAGQIVGFALVQLPIATTELATEVGAHSALLHGTLSADDGPEASCEFQYTTEAAFLVEEFASATSVACSPPGPYIGSALEAVSAGAVGLAPETAYRFRIVASNENGPNPGQALAFHTAGPPAIVAESVETVGLSDATLSAKINPNGAKTTYHVEYGTTASYGQSTAESAPIGFESDHSDYTASVHIGGLASGTAYHFRFVATSLGGSGDGADSTFATYPSTPAFEPCSNDQFRTGFGGRLSDCRAYEQATPIDKHGANIQGSLNAIQASSSGDRITFFLNGGLPTTGGSSRLAAFLASRGPGGWSSDGLLPPTPPVAEAMTVGWSDDLSTTLVASEVVTSATPIVGSAMYLRDSGTAAFQPGPAAAGSRRLVESALAGFAADTSHLIFETSTTLAAGAAPGEFNLYDLDHGAVTLPGRIPSSPATSCDDVSGPACVPAPDGAFAGPYAWGDGTTAFGGAEDHFYTQNTISRDGSRVFFTTRNAAQLYVREDGAATTQISASQATVPDPNGEKPAAFMAATTDGSKVFFTSCEKLTDDSTAFSNGEHSCTESGGLPEVNVQGQDLYSYDVDTGELADLTVDANASDPKGAEVQGVLGASDDGSYVYFVANGALAPGASPGNCLIRFENGGTCSLYVSHDGSTTFIASLGAGDLEDWTAKNFAGSERPKASRVAPGGRTLLFSSTRSLTGYDNLASVDTSGLDDRCGDGSVGAPCRELFRYSAPAEELTCPSCNPTGVPPRGDTSLGTLRVFVHDAPRPGTFLTRNLSADGSRVFFDSRDALLPTDTNSVNDVYEWEAEGFGTCHTSGGCIYLLSSGTSPDPSYFADASVDGDHAFLFTDQQLVPTDRDQLYDIYDAGSGAGLASQYALAPPTCTGTACQANPPPPPDQGLASSAFSGSGNAHGHSSARKCAKGKRRVRKAGKVRCQKAGKQHKLHSNRGGSK